MCLVGLVVDSDEVAISDEDVVGFEALDGNVKLRLRDWLFGKATPNFDQIASANRV